MKIHLERSGGFGGIAISKMLDSDSIDRSKADEINQLVHSMNFFNLQSGTSGITTPKGAADYFTYKITIQQNKRKHSVECTDINMDPKFKSLVNLVQKLTNK